MSMNKKPRVPRSGNYLQFPLCALAYGKSEHDRLNAIISYGLVETGKVFWSRATDAQRAGYLNTWSVVKCLPPDFDSCNPLHVVAVLGARVIGIEIYSAVETVTPYEALRHFFDKYQARNGTDATVRLRRDFVFEARDAKGMTPRELAVLAAIYSVIGKKRYPVRITRETIIHRALGYRSKEIAMREHSRRSDGAKFFTEWKLRCTIDSLAARKFFRQLTYGQRQTFYTNRMDEAEFRAALIARKTRHSTFKRTQRRKNESLTNTIRKLRRKPDGQ